MKGGFTVWHLVRVGLRRENEEREERDLGANAIEDCAGRLGRR